MDYRFAQPEDSGIILNFIRELATYEHMLDEVIATEELLREWIFEKKKAEVIFALEDGKEVGFALFFHNFSTFLGRAGIYLEDLFVLPEYRGKGYGKGLLKKLAKIIELNAVLNNLQIKKRLGSLLEEDVQHLKKIADNVIII